MSPKQPVLGTLRDEDVLVERRRAPDPQASRALARAVARERREPPERLELPWVPELALAAE
ncbi:MAG: hypothetical protein H6719_28405 [Sandaracinaceae bacterium]|nr:hypothetical protein [Sandaracinaceae bacterium]